MGVLCISISPAHHPTTLTMNSLCLPLLVLAIATCALGEDYCKLKRTWISGSPIWEGNVDGMWFCRKKCDADSSCQAFTYEFRGKFCWLHGDEDISDVWPGTAPGKLSAFKESSNRHSQCLVDETTTTTTTEKQQQQQQQHQQQQPQDQNQQPQEQNQQPQQQNHQPQQQNQQPQQQ